MGIARPQVLTAHDCDVAVVGGGPAGLICARDLARRGRRVVVIEEHDHIGSPVHCTGVLGLDAFEELELSGRTILSITHSAKFVSADGTVLPVAADRVRAAVVDRAAFDHDLAGEAARAGALLSTGDRVRDVAESGDRVVLRTSRGVLSARAAVLACGASYRLNRTLGFGLPRLLGHTAQVEVPFAPSGPELEVHFGREVAPGGFGWVVPFERGGDPFARIGILSEGRALEWFARFAARVRRIHGIDRPWQAPRIKVLPLAPVKRTWRRRVLAVGDAAGIVKPTTGGGIYYGLLTGRLAADVLSSALRDNSFEHDRLKDYERIWRKRLGPEIRAGMAFRAVAARLTDGAIDTLVELARVNGIVPVLKKTADFNWHRTAALSLLRNASFRRVVVSSMFG
jgi:digeranylgeranylglycerophospholipid reductase